MAAASEVSGEKLSPRRLLIDATAFVIGLSAEFVVDTPKAMFAAGAIALAKAADAVWHVHQSIPPKPQEAQSGA